MYSYVEKVLWTLLKTSFSKRSFCYLVISIITLIIRIHIDGILGYILRTPYEVINLILRIIVSCILIIKTKYIYDMVQRYEPEIYNIVRYSINNYNEKNFKKWKRNINLTICIYIYIITYIINITNESIRQIIIEYIICYFMIDIYENYMNGQINILNMKEYECKMNDDLIINNLINKTENYDEELFDIKKT